MPAGAEAQVIATELERVSPKVPVMFERDDVFYSNIEKRPVEKISSRDMRAPMELRPGGKSGHWSSDGGDMGRGNMPTYDKAVINTVELIHRLEWTTRREWGTDDTRKAVINAVRRDIASGMKEFRRYIDSLCMTVNGVLGTISNVATAGGVDTYTLGTANYNTTNTDGFGARLIRFDQDFNVYSGDLATNRNTAAAAADSTVTFIDYPNKIIKAAQLAGVIAGDVIVAQGLKSTPPVSLLGIPYHHSNASTGTWLGFDRSTTPEIRANRVSANKSALTLPLPRLALNKIGDRLGINQLGKKLTAWAHPCQQQAYEELGFEVIRIDKAAREEGLDLYFNDNMRVAGAPFKKSYSWDKTRMDFVDNDLWGRAEFHQVGFYKDKNGNSYFPAYGTSGGIAASNLTYIVASFNIYVSNPGGVSYIDQLGVPTGY